MVDQEVNVEKRSSLKRVVNNADQKICYVQRIEFTSRKVYWIFFHLQMPNSCTLENSRTLIMIFVTASTFALFVNNDNFVDILAAIFFETKLTFKGPIVYILYA